MFTYVELSNFKSFGHIRFDFKKSKNDCKKFVAIYGENGSGKSNFVSAIELLSHLTTSFVSMLQIEHYKKQMMEKINMYWGKHSFLALVLAEKRSKNEKFIYDNLSTNMLKVLDCFMHVFILCKATNSLHTGIICGSNISISDFDNINIESNDKKKLQLLHKIEKIIKNFYVQAYTDIIDVYYNATVANNDNKIYKLYVKKIIANKVRTIPFEEESAGTQRVLSVLRAILEAINGQTVVYDEIDDGIHDLLMCNILLSVQNDIKGQLIITTHNTLLLEDLNPKSAYVIYSDVDGNKEARCVDDYDIRIQSSNNQRKLYLNGVFGGIPYSSQIDYSSNDYKFDNLEE